MYGQFKQSDDINELAYISEATIANVNFFMSISGKIIAQKNRTHVDFLNFLSFNTPYPRKSNIFYMAESIVEPNDLLY